MKDDPLYARERQTRDRRRAAAPEPSAPVHSNHQSRGAYRLRRPQAISSFQYEARSLAQTVQNRT